MSVPRTILIHEYVTGGGLAGQELPRSLAVEGNAMRRALAADFAALEGVRVRVTLDARLAEEPGPWEVVRVRSGEEPAILMTLADEVDDVIVIAPETDDLLAQRSSLLMVHRARHLGSTPAAIEAVSDKSMLARLLSREGVPTPEGVLVFSEEDLPDLLEYPLVLKPLDGAGTLRTFLLRHAEDRPAGAFDQLPALVQRFVPGIPMSASFLVDCRGVAHLIAVGRQEVELREGCFHYRGGWIPQGPTTLAEEARRALKAVPGLLGWVGVDFVWDETCSKTVILEINPRLTTSFVPLARLFPPGTLACAWLDAVDAPETLAARDLAAEVHARPSIRFTVDGAIATEEDRS